MAGSRLLDAAAMLERGELEPARQLLVRHLQVRPGDAEACTMLAVIHQRSGDPVRALVFAERALAARPEDPRYACNVAALLTQAGRADKARDLLARAVARAPANPDVRLAFAGALDMSSDFFAAERECLAALELAPNDPRAIGAYLSILIEMGRSADAVDWARRGVAAHPDDWALASQLCHAINYLPDASPEDILEAHRAFARTLARALPPTFPPYENARDPNKKLRVAIVSGDLRQHSVAYYIEPFLERHDRARFELVAFPTFVLDKVSERLLKHVARAVPVQGADALSLAARIYEQRPDIVLELSGHTHAPTLAALSFRPAPVQASYLGYPATTGLEAIDARLVDSLTDPPGAEALCVERLERLDPCFLCYRPPAPGAASPPPARAPGDEVRFGSFNACAKLSPAILRVWARLLARVPGSRLVLKSSSFIDPNLRAEIARRLASWGAPADRLDILTPTQGVGDHLAMYERLDVALDPFPYHGTTTTCEALHMGVPVVTLAGRHHAARVGVSILASVGLDDLIARDEEHYLEVAARLAADAPRRRELRSTLRARLAASPLCDEEAHTRRLEGALRDAWRRWCAGAPG